MVFSSIVFLLYFLPVFLTVYFLVDRKYKNGVILVSSIIFYAWGGPKFIFVILGTTMIDFYLVRWMYYAKKQIYRKIFLLASLSINVGLLFYFKYANFFIENINQVLSAAEYRELAWLNVVLPIGISFYTFETITYVVDVYRRVHAPLHKFWDYQLYIIFFSKLIAGPIVRYHEIADQISDRFSNENNENRLTGFYRFVLGLSKKVLLANPLGLYADQVMNPNFTQIDSPIAWLGILAYALQIYFDFSGYSDMAIGIAKMVGFVFPENFNNPYISQSITEFWRRWHITLGKWMKNYLYIPLGGNRVHSKRRVYFNLWIVFLASGFWHGASWNFIIWGAFHGCFLVMERAFLNTIYARLNIYIRILINFIIVMVGWVFFRLESLDEALNYLRLMFNFSFLNMPTPGYQVFITMAFALFFAFFAILPYGQSIQDKVYFKVFSTRLHCVFLPVTILLFVVCVAMISGSGFNPFIYFRF